MFFDNHKHCKNAASSFFETDRLHLDEIIACLGACVDPSAANNRTPPVLEDEIDVDVELSLNHWDLPPGRYSRLTISSADFKRDTSSACLVFEPFFCKTASDDDNDRDLAWVYKTVISCNGSIIVRNDPHGGTTFEVFLPVKQKSINKVIDPTRLSGLVPASINDIVHQFGMTA